MPGNTVWCLTSASQCCLWTVPLPTKRAPVFSIQIHKTWPTGLLCCAVYSGTVYAIKSKNKQSGEFKNSILLSIKAMKRPEVISHKATLSSKNCWTGWFFMGQYYVDHYHVMNIHRTIQQDEFPSESLESFVLFEWNDLKHIMANCWKKPNGALWINKTIL